MDYVNDNNVTHLYSFGVEHIPKEIYKIIGNKKINFCRVQGFSSVMCGYFCIKFIDFMLKVKNLSEYTHLFSPNEYEKVTE